MKKNFISKVLIISLFSVLAACSNNDELIHEEYLKFMMPKLKEGIQKNRVEYKDFTDEHIEKLITQSAEKLAECYVDMINEHYEDQLPTFIEQLKAGKGVVEAKNVVDREILAQVKAEKLSYDQYKKHVLEAEKDFTACSKPDKK